MSQQPNVYADRLRRLADAFQAGYPSCPPLRHAVLTGIGSGVNVLGQNWTLLLQGEGYPWKCGALPDFERQDEQRWGSSWRECWFTDWEGADLTGAWRAFLDLAEEAARCRYGLLRLGPADPEKTSFVGEEWVAALHQLSWRAGDPALRAHCYRFHQRFEDPETLIRVSFADAMAVNPKMMSAPMHVGDRVIQMSDERAPLAFPHGLLSVLGPDVYRASACAVDALLAGQVQAATSEAKTPTGEAVIISLGNRQYRIGDYPPVIVTDNEDTVLQALAEQPAMDEPALRERSGLENAAKILRDLRTKYKRIFQAAVRTPGRKGQGGYYAVIKSAP
jgi:hypothetical protein